MRGKTIKIVSLMLAGAILLGLGATAVSAKNTDLARLAKQEAQEKQTLNKDCVPGKDETVYVLSAADGTPREILVSDWLKNPEQADVIRDVSSLKDIENVKGHETFTEEKGNVLAWNADGSDIYYQGVAEKDPPVEIKVSYTLDGKSMTPEELAGKTGRVTIRFDYTNKETVKVDGEKIYVPFAVVTGVMLDTEVFSNVTVTNGKMENLGNQMAVLGIALPGMKDNLDTEELELPDFVEITADAENFRLGSTMSLATTALFENMDAGSLDIEKLKEQAERLTDGMTQLMDGSDQLYEGMNTLLDQVDVLVNGVDQLAVGATRLKAGADALNGGAGQLQSGAAQLSQGLSTLDSNSASLNDGAQQVFNTLLTAANTQLQAAGLNGSSLTIGNYAAVLNGIIESLDENAVYEAALQQVTAGVEAKRGEITAAVTQVIREQVEVQVLAQVSAAVREQVTDAVKEQENQFLTVVVKQATGMTLEQYQAAVEGGKVTQEQQNAIQEAVKGAMAAEVEKQMESEEVKGKINAAAETALAQQMDSEKVKGLIAENTELQVQKAISDTMASPEIQGKLQAAAEGAKAVIALKASLDSYNGFYLGVKAYTAGVGTAAAGAKDLISGADTLKSGMESLDSGAANLSQGIQTMKGKTPQMVEGITALRDGSLALKDGLTQLMQEGIQKIADLAQKDLQELVTNLSRVIDAGQSYSNFTGLEEGTEGTVKFIYKTEEISTVD